MYEHLIQVVGGIVAGIITAVLWSLCIRWHKSRRGRVVAEFWAFTHDDVYVVRPSYRSPSGEEMDENMARVEDILAIDAITAMLKQRRVRYHLVDHSFDVPGDADVVLVCSPKGNRKSEEALKALPLPYSFEMDESRTPYFIDVKTKTKFQSPMDTSNGSTDIAMIGRYTRKDTGQLVFLLWGIHGVGTLGAARCATDSSILAHLNQETMGQDFAVLVECAFASIRDIGKCRLLTQARCATA